MVTMKEFPNIQQYNQDLFRRILDMMQDVSFRGIHRNIENALSWYFTSVFRQNFSDFLEFMEEQTTYEH